jgi:hypothetical protein
MPTPLDLRFESTAPATLRAWLTSLGWTGQMGQKAPGADARILDFGPYVEAPVAGTQMGFIYLVATEALTPPAGILHSTIAIATVGGGVAAPPLPTPFEWLTRAGITGQRRLALFIAMRSNPTMAAILDSILVLQAVDSTDPEIQATVPMVAAAGLLTPAEAAALLAP